MTTVSMISIHATNSTGAFVKGQSSIPCQKLKLKKPFLPSTLRTKPSFSNLFLHKKSKSHMPLFSTHVRAQAVAEAEAAEDSLSSSPPSELEKDSQVQKLGVVVKPIEKPRLVLKFIWMEKNIGIALDQVIPGYGTIPLSPYYFWPRKDAWEELKTKLESKPWISQKRMIILLNQATDIINLWQQSGGNLS